MNDLELGTKTLQFFLQYSAPYGLSLSVEELALQVNKYPQIFIDGLGLSVRTVLDNDEGKIISSMQTLAEKSEGRIPSQATFFAAIRDEGQDYSFFEAASSVVSGTASDLLDGAQAIGDSVINTGKFLVWLLPVGVIGFIYLYAKKRL